MHIHSQITGQKFKHRLKEDAVPSEFDYAMRPKKHDYQAKIALNNADMKKLVFYNILYAFISATNMPCCPI